MKMNPEWMVDRAFWTKAGKSYSLVLSKPVRYEDFAKVISTETLGVESVVFDSGDSAGRRFVPTDSGHEFRRSASALLDRAFSSLPRESFAELLGHIAEEGQRLSKTAIAYDPATDSYTGPCTVGDTRVRPAPKFELDGAAQALVDHTRNEVRDAALEDAATRIQGARDWIVAAGFIRALKSKPAPLCLTPGCEKPTGHAPPHEPCGAKPAPQPSGNPGELKDCPTLDCILPASHRSPHCGKNGLEFNATAEPTHDFGWALARMREGNRVRRTSWVNGSWLKIDGESIVTDHARAVDLHTSNMLATDWQVVE